MNKLFTTLIIMFLSLTQLHAQKADKMSITDINGKTYNIEGTKEGLKIAGLEGKVVFLEFFGHRCPPCLASIPHLVKLKEKYKDRLAIVAVEVQGHSTSELKNFYKNRGMNYIVATQDSATNFITYIQQRAQWKGSIPFTVALDTKGDVQFVQAGMIPEDYLEKLVQELSSTPNKSSKTTKQ